MVSLISAFIGAWQACSTSRSIGLRLSSFIAEAFSRSAPEEDRDEDSQREDQPLSQRRFMEAALRATP